LTLISVPVPEEVMNCHLGGWVLIDIERGEMKRKSIAVVNKDNNLLAVNITWVQNGFVIMADEYIRSRLH
jgi:hypothetical protein